MKVFGLPGHLIRNARMASRLIDAKTPDIVAEIRRDALQRWRAAMAQGFTSEVPATKPWASPARTSIAGRGRQGRY